MADKDFYRDGSNSGPAGSRVNDNREPRNRELPASRLKDSRYVDREKDHRAPHPKPALRDDRDRRGVIENKQTMPLSSRDHRYGGSNASGPGRSDRSGSTWAVPNQKPFPSSGPNKQWRPNSSVTQRWPSGPQGNTSIRPYSGNSQPNMASMSPAPPGLNRYQDSRQNYGKSIIANTRKY